MAIPFAAARALPWRWIGIGLLVAAILVQTLRLSYAERRADKAQFALNEARAALDDLARKTEAQKIESERRIKEAQKRIDNAVPKGLETRPLPQNCATPDTREWGAIL